MRKPIVAGNWKMNKTPAEAADLARAMLAELSAVPGVDRVLCPPFVALAAVAEVIKGSPLGLGAQNIYWKDAGAFTGEVSPVMLKGWCQYVIIGHSERRQFFGETDETVNKKIFAALRTSLVPIVCVGESLAEREKNETEKVIGEQLTVGFRSLTDLQFSHMIVAYEPVWAIGTGRTATPELAAETHRFIRATIAKMFSLEAGAATRILYGGSVKPDNIKGLMAQPEIDGALVGGASLKPDSFAAIVNF
jgi:triosephosphate isomerase